MGSVYLTIQVLLPFLLRALARTTPSISYTTKPTSSHTYPLLSRPSTQPLPYAISLTSMQFILSLQPLVPDQLLSKIVSMSTMVSFVVLFFSQDSPFINCKNLPYKGWLDYQTTDSAVPFDC